MSVRTYCLVTFGCQMNDADSEMIAGILEAKGWKAVSSEDEADLVLFNTCVVRQGAENRAVARLHRLKPVPCSLNLLFAGPLQHLLACGVNRPLLG